jgi:DNA-3-methyladenine glycosylase I
MKRCQWATNDLAIAYHDAEWGLPVHEDRVHFEFITLEGAQAGLSWDTVLRKRERYRALFEQFDPARVARFTPARIEKLLLDPGIIRHRGKIESAVGNARAFLRVQSEFGSFDAYVWRFVDGKPLRNAWKESSQIPASTPLSDALSKDLRRRGFRFAGSTICYSYMQAVGLIDDHVLSCFRRRP